MLRAIAISLGVIFAVAAIHRLPLSAYLEQYTTEYSAETIEDIILNFTSIFILLFLILKLAIPVGLNNWTQHTNLVFFLPLVLYGFVFSGLSVSLQYFHLDFITSPKMVLYAIETFSAACLEEFLFRGLIVGVLLASTTYTTEKWLITSVLLASFLFGFTHIINIWTQEADIKSALNQVYATFCIGVMWSSVYIKTRNLALIIIVHFLSNYFAGMEDMAIDNQNINTPNKEGEDSVFELVVEEVLRLIIFGIPLFIGIFILKFVTESDKNAWLNKIKHLNNQKKEVDFE